MHAFLEKGPEIASQLLSFCNLHSCSDVASCNVSAGALSAVDDACSVARIAALLLGPCPILFEMHVG